MKGAVISITLDSGEEGSQGPISEENLVAFTTGCHRLIHAFTTEFGGPIEVIRIIPHDRRGYSRYYEVKLVLRCPRQGEDPDKTETKFDFYPHSEGTRFCKDANSLTQSFVELCLKEIETTLEKKRRSLSKVLCDWSLVTQKTDS